METVNIQEGASRGPLASLCGTAEAAVATWVPLSPREFCRVEGAREGNYFPGIREEENWRYEKALGISYLEVSRER